RRPIADRPACRYRAWQASRCQSLFELAVDENEGDPAVAVRAVGPAMIGAALDDDVARANGRFALVHDQHDLAFKDNAIIDRLCAVHARMARAGTIVRRGGPRPDFREVGARLGGSHAVEARIVGRNVEHADAGPVSGWRESNPAFLRFARGGVDRRRRRTCVPDLVEQRPYRTADTLDSWNRSVFLDHGPSLSIVPGDDPANTCFGHRLPFSCVHSPSVSANQSAIR